MPGFDAENGPASSELGLGERLRSARKARALSLEQVAESLHLDESVILALEDERYEAFGAPVFVRGHLRAYARLVGLPVDGVLEAYRQAVPDNDAAPVIARGKTNHSVAVNPVMWGFSGLVVLVGLALAYYVLQGDRVEFVAVTPRPAGPILSPETIVQPMPETIIEPTSGPPERSALEAQIAETTIKAETVETPLVAAVEPAIDEEFDRLLESPTDAEREPVAGIEVDQGAETVRLSLHFRQASWVEIYDVNRRLLFGLEREGRRRELTGEPPFQFLFGNGSGVDLSVNDKPYAFPVASAGRVTRFEIAPELVE